MRIFVSAARPTTRALAAAAIFLALLGRVGALGIALAIGRNEIRLATAVGLAVAGLFGLLRMVQGAARVAMQCDLHDATVRALLDGDLLEVPTVDTQRVVFEGNHHASKLVAAILPALVADVVASTLMVPILALLFPVRVIAMALLLFVVILLVAVPLRRITGGLQARSVRAYQDVGDAVLLAIEGAIEIVASGAEGRVMAGLAKRLTSYRRLAVRSEWMSALLGRVPILAGFSCVAGVLVLDATSRDALATAVGSRALVMAAALPALLGCVLGAHALTRTAALAAPFAALLAQPPRSDRARVGKGCPALPAEIGMERLGFAYHGASALVFRDLGREWRAGEPLVIVGPNGSGKSTLLRLLVGLRAPTEGILRVAGRDLEEIDVRALRREVAYLPQRPYLGEPYASLRDALCTGSGTLFDDGAMRRALARTHVGDLLRPGGRDVLDVSVGELSVGQRQRVALARLLLRDARMVLLDEPDANLDREGVALVAKLVRELSAAGVMVAIAAHTPELAALSPEPILLGASEPTLDAADETRERESGRISAPPRHEPS